MARRKHREGQGLQKVLGVPALFSTAYGNVGSSIYYALGLVALWALGVTPVVFLLTGLLFCTTAWSYAEATAMVPEAGGSSSFGRRAFNEFVSFGAGWALMLDYIVTVAISAYFVPNYLSVFWPALKTFPYNSIGGIVTIVFLVALNVVGIKEAARLNIVLALLDLATQVLLMVVGVVLLLQPKLLLDQIQLGVAPTWTHLIYGISIGTIAYTGIETVSNMSEEAANPDRDVPRAINFVLIAVLVVYLGISLTALSAMPVKPNVLPVDAKTGKTLPIEVVAKSAEEPNGPFVFKGAPPPGNEGPDVYVPAELRGDRWVTTPEVPTTAVFVQDGQRYTKVYGSLLGSVYKEDPVVGIVRFLPTDLGWLKTILLPWVGILAATILLIATNAGLIGVSRLAYSLGQHRQVPPILGRVHPKRLTPYVAIIAFGAVACFLLLLPGNTINLLADLYAFGAMISFTVAHVSVVWLRHKEPDYPRPFRTPINIQVGKMSVPVLAVDRRHRHLHRVVRGRRHAPLRPDHRLPLDGDRPAHVRRLPQGEGLFADQDRREGRGARVDAGRRRLRPDPRAHHRHAHQRRDDGARVSARNREEVRHRRPVRDRGAAEPAARREPGQRAGEGGAGAQGGGDHRLAVQGQVHAAHGDGAAGRARDRRGGHHQTQRGRPARHHAQAARREPHLRGDDGLRARPRAVRSPPQSGPEGLSYGGLERHGRT